MIPDLCYNFAAFLKAEFSPYGQISDAQLKLLENHYLLLLQWNKKLNLTRIEGMCDAVRYHYCESLFLAHFLPPQPLNIVDIGSGAGFPGFPVAVWRPDCSVDLVESHQRKAVFLREATRDVPNVRVLSQRAEDLNVKYDWVISRAVRPESLLDLNLADDLAVLCTQGEKLPWGNSRALFHVKRPG